MCDRDKRTCLIHRSRNDSRKKFYNSCPCYWTNLAQRFIFEITSKNISNGGRVVYTRVFEVRFCIAFFKSFHFQPAGENDSKRKIRTWRVFAIIALKNAWWNRSSKTHVAMTLDIWKNLVPVRQPNRFQLGGRVDDFSCGRVDKFPCGRVDKSPCGRDTLSNWFLITSKLIYRLLAML